MPPFGKSIAQYVYQLEAQSAVTARITAAGGVATATDPRQGRNLGLSATVAINAHEFLVLERDNRGIGIDDPAGASVIGSKRVFKIDIEGAEREVFETPAEWIGKVGAVMVELHDDINPGCHEAFEKATRGFSSSVINGETVMRHALAG